MDFLCFYITAALMHRRMPKIRTVISCTAGGIYSVAALFFSGVPTVVAFLFDVAVCIAMCAAVFAQKGKRFMSVLFMSGVYFAVSALMGGVMTAVYNLLNRLDLPLSEISADGLDAWAVALLAAVGGAVTMFGGKVFRKKTAQKTCRTVISFGGISVTVDSVCDSGNMLCDPISGKKVIVADIDRIKMLLPKEIYTAMKSSGCRSCPVEIRENVFSQRIRLIPSRTANGSGMLYAFVPDSTEIENAKGERHRVDAVIALSEIPEGALVPSEFLV